MTGKLRLSVVCVVLCAALLVEAASVQKAPRSSRFLKLNDEADDEAQDAPAKRQPQPQSAQSQKAKQPAKVDNWFWRYG